MTLRRNNEAPRRRAAGRAGLVLLVLGLVSGLVACGSGEDTETGAGVTITHNFGETTVSGTPERIVTLGSQWLDATQAMGVTPVAYADSVAMGGKSQLPWTPPELEQATVLKMGGDMAEQIATMEPDLILVPSFLVDQPMYEKLSQLAPTIGAVTANAQVDKWSDQLTTLGKVLHREDKATEVIAGVNAKIDAVAQKYPNLKGKTFLTCMLTGPAQLMVLADPNDGSAEMFTRLGMSIPANISAQANTGGRLALSPERLNELTSDALICGAMPQFEAKFKELPGYNELPAVRSGGIAFVDTKTISAINTPTPLSIPFLLETLDPTFAAVGR
ncbi:ABC transporter substrate-binding protein [Nocardia sp. NPDC059177]|uniref:ABC transporter substrate-binding protein n=1 Tax=Nocardia sp. NPDC059177 TaxID=3346759 RepID=UPI003675E42D